MHYTHDEDAERRRQLIAQLGIEPQSAQRDPIPLDLFTNAHCAALNEAIQCYPALFTRETVVELMRAAARRLIGERRAVTGGLYAKHRARFSEEIERREGWNRLLREVSKP